MLLTQLAAKQPCECCRRSKYKCEPASNSHGWPCSRCCRLSLQCTRLPSVQADESLELKSASTPEVPNKENILPDVQYPQHDNSHDTRTSSGTFDLFKANDHLWSEPGSQIRYTALVTVANTASRTILSIAHSKSILFQVHKLEDIYRSVFQIIYCHGSRAVLVEWGDAMGKSKRTKYSKKPGWWPENVEFKDPKKLSSDGEFFRLNFEDVNRPSDVKFVLYFLFCGYHGSSVLLRQLYVVLKHINLKRRDRQLLTWIIFIKRVSLIPTVRLININ